MPCWYVLFWKWIPVNSKVGNDLLDSFTWHISSRTPGTFCWYPCSSDCDMRGTWDAHRWNSRCVPDHPDGAEPSHTGHPTDYWHQHLQMGNIALEDESDDHCAQMSTNVYRLWDQPWLQNPGDWNSKSRGSKMDRNNYTNKSKRRNCSAATVARNIYVWIIASQDI